MFQYPPLFALHPFADWSLHLGRCAEHSQYQHQSISYNMPSLYPWRMPLDLLLSLSRDLAVAYFSYCFDADSNQL